ncbi:MAG: helix-turn-helix transcriptional regulator [Bacilli bacterium]|nr:helix-turn-helix transcriptional regulator [Bacilli bacterium]
MQNTLEILGDVIKSSRQRSEITMEELAYKIGVTERYLYRIENENKKPSFDVLFRLIRELSIDPDEIFYPEKQSFAPETNHFIHMLYTCDERSITISKEILKILLNNF